MHIIKGGCGGDDDSKFKEAPRAQQGPTQKWGEGGGTATHIVAHEGERAAPTAAAEYRGGSDDEGGIVGRRARDGAEEKDTRTKHTKTGRAAVA